MNLENPMETNGFEFIEFTGPESKHLRDIFLKLGFDLVARHRSKNVVLYRQGNINFIINSEQNSFASEFAGLHGPSICAIGIKIRNSNSALKRAVDYGCLAVSSRIGPMELNIPAIEGIGGSLIYLVEQKFCIYDIDFMPVKNLCSKNIGLSNIDHLTHNVFEGQMDKWVNFYEDLFGFKEIRYFDIEGKLTGLRSRALVSACGKMRIPVNESIDDKSQIVEFLKEYNGEGIQHIAFETNDIYQTVEKLKENGIQFLEVPDTYYEQINERIPNHNEDIDRLKANKILIDGTENEILLQIFTKTLIGPIFFEIIQRKGNNGFGEGNFKALFESIELDQIRRGVLKDE